MVELSPESDGRYRAAFGGDALNTAVYLARCGVATRFMSPVGDDPHSMALLEELAAEGVDASAVTVEPGGNLGLYLISVDSEGERSFRYWRGESPARRLFEGMLPPATSLLYLTGISVAVGRRGPGGDDRIVAFLAAAKAAGVRVAFDPNYRPALWPSAGEARATVERVLPYCDIALPTLADEVLLFGDGSLERCDARYARFGVSERVFKGAGGQLAATGPAGRVEHQADLIAAVDTTAAGDALNAGYLAVRLAGGSPAEALACGARLARHVVSFPGALSPRHQWPEEGFA